MLSQSAISVIGIVRHRELSSVYTNISFTIVYFILYKFTFELLLFNLNAIML